MQLTIELPDSLATQLQTIPNLNEFVTNVLTQSLTESSTQEETLFDFLSGYIGTIDGSHEALSENTGVHFTQILMGKSHESTNQLD